jgi:hypothetical protein
MPKRRKKKPSPRVAPQFKVGERVRVKHGVMDPAYPDLPLGGWSGEIREIHRDGAYTVRWTEETLESIHPIYKKRCNRDETGLEEYWLGDEDLEPDPGGPLSIDHPGRIVPRPLSHQDQGDRVRMVFGLTSDDLLPRPSEETLETYYDYLAKRLTFPFEARYVELEEGKVLHLAQRSVEVVGLDKDVGWDEDYGIVCEGHTSHGEDTFSLANLDFRRTGPNARLLLDYREWFRGELVYDDDDEADEDFDDEEIEKDDEDLLIEARLVSFSPGRRFAELVLGPALFAAVFGSAVAAIPWAPWAAGLAGGLWALFAAVGALLGRKQAKTSFTIQRVTRALWVMIPGAIQGAFVGILVVALPGTLLGALAGLAINRIVGHSRWPGLVFFPKGAWCGAFCGVVAQAFYWDHARASVGLALAASAVAAVTSLIALVGMLLTRLVRKLPNLPAATETAQGPVRQ